MRRKHYPNYTVRRAILLLLFLWAAVIGLTRGCDSLFPTDYSPTEVAR